MQVFPEEEFLFGENLEGPDDFPMKIWPNVKRPEMMCHDLGPRSDYLRVNPELRAHTYPRKP